MNKNRYKLNRKIVLSLIVFVLLPTLFTNLFLQLHFKKRILQNAEFAFENAVVNVDNTINTLMTELGIALNMISTDTDLYSALESPHSEYPQNIYTKITIDNLFSKIQRSVLYSHIDFLILDQNGTCYSTYYIKQPEALQSAATRGYFDELHANDLKFTYFTTPVSSLGKNTDENVLCIGKTIRNHKKKLLGSVILILNENKLSDLIQESSLYTDSVNLLSDRNGIIISSADKSLLGTAADDYLLQKEAYQILSYPLSNNWTFTSMIKKEALYQDMDYTTMIIVVNLALVLIFIVMSTVIIRTFLKPVNHLKDLMMAVENGDFTPRFHSSSDDELTDLGICFNHMTENLALLFDRNQKQQRKLLERENEKERYRYMVLQSQINPHFMFNTLNNIKWKALINQDTEVAGAITSFGRLLEKIIKSGGDHSTVEEELSYIEEYMQIMQLHCPSPVTLTVSLDQESLKECKILRLLFQPIVENAILHGLRENRNDPCIRILISSEGKYLICRISDNGTGMTDEQIQLVMSGATRADSLSHSIGISNTIERIRLFHGKQYGLTIASRPGEGTEVTMILPYS